MKSKIGSLLIIAAACSGFSGLASAQDERGERPGRNPAYSGGGGGMSGSRLPVNNEPYATQPVNRQSNGDISGTISQPSVSKPIKDGTRIDGVGVVGPQSGGTSPAKPSSGAVYGPPAPSKGPSGGAGSQGLSSGGGVNGPKGSPGGGGTPGSLNQDDRVRRVK